MNRSWPVTEEQAAVVEARGGVVTVSATAGSGKTRAVIYAALDHIGEGVPGERILLVAYNRAAAKEMKDRMIRWAPDDMRAQAADVEVSTFHAFCLSLLRQNRQATNVLEDRDARRWMGSILRDDMRDFDTDPVEVLTKVSYYREVMPGYRTEAWDAAGCPPTASAAAAFYLARMRREGVIDFTEMQAAVMRLIDADPTVRARVCARFDLMCLDEAQDQNPLRSAIWARLTGIAYGHQIPRTVIMVGDAEGQAIYRFAGATPEVFLAYQAAASTRLTLSRNFRCHPDVVVAGNRVLGRDVGIPARDRDGVPDPVVSVVEYDEAAEEAAAVATAIKDRIAGGTAPRDIAVIYRTRSAGAETQIALLRSGIPFVIRGGSGFFGRGAVQDAVAHLEAVTTWDIEAIGRASKTPTRFLGNAFRAAMEALAGRGIGGPDLVSPDRYDSRQMRGVRCLRQHLATVALACDDGPCPALEAVYGLQGLKGQTFATSGPEEKMEEREELLATLLEIAGGFDSVEDFIAMAKMATHAESQADGADPPDAVVLTTAHRSKGCEWPVVYVIGMSQGVWPHRLALAENAEDEERRLAFVAVTRAKDALVVSARGTYFGQPRSPSIYIAALRGETTMTPTQWPDANRWAAWLKDGCQAGRCPPPRHAGGEV